MKKRYLLFFAGLVGCTSQPRQPLATVSGSKTLIAIVADYSKSYKSLVTVDSSNATSIMLTVARSGGSLVHIPVADNSSAHPVYMQQIEKLDTTNTAAEKNLYTQARMREENRKKAASFMPSLQGHVSDFLTEIRKYEASQFSDIEHSLHLAESTVCEPIYTNGSTHYKRFVLILSDVLNEPPQTKNKHLSQVDFCGASVLIVRPSPDISRDSLQYIFSADVHIFTTINDAITFINQQ